MTLMSTPLRAHLAGVGLLGPGLASWPAAAAVLAGRAPYQAVPTVLPAPAVLPPAERRRAGKIVKAAIAVALEAVTAAGADPASLPTVFTASGGDGYNCHQICADLASDDRLISPTRFHNSVHNAAAGYWSIATGATPPSAVLCAYDGSFAAGLLEAMTQVAVDGHPCLLVACDADYPEPLRSTRPVPDACGVAMLLTPQAAEGSLGRLAVTLTDAPAAALADPALERLRRAIPAARALPLLAMLARGEQGTVVLDYLDDLRVAVELAR